MYLTVAPHIVEFDPVLLKLLQFRKKIDKSTNRMYLGCLDQSLVKNQDTTNS